MGTLLLLGVGIFIGWLLFRPKADKREREAAPQRPLASQSPVTRPTLQEHKGSNHTLRNVAGGMAAGAVLGHMLSSDKKTEIHETINNYNAYDEVYDHEAFADHEIDDEDSYIGDYYDDDDDDDYVVYDDDYSVDSYDYDSSSDWDSDSFEDSSEW